MTEEEIEALWGELAADVRRVSHRLRSLSAARLAAPCGSFGSAADAGRAAAQAMADAAAAMELAGADRAGSGGWVRRELPRLSEFAVGDQVAVTGNDLLALLSAPGGGQIGVEWEQVAEAARLLTEVRRAL